ncbi:MAG: DUF859 domain-containing protein [Kitasatospora sp.]|nr:DUF859 domain-containing protein [Kitasatospora sp.]
MVLITSITTLIMTAGSPRDESHRTRLPTTVAAPTPMPTVTPSPGTQLLSCDSATYGQLGKNWREDSLRAGPLWFADGMLDGYVHHGNIRLLAQRRYSGVKEGMMIIEAANGSTVTIKPAADARRYFRFTDGFNGPSPNNLPAGDTGFTLSACPREDTGPNGRVTDYLLGFVFKAARPAAVNIWTGASARPIRVIFTYPSR